MREVPVEQGRDSGHGMEDSPQKPSQESKGTLAQSGPPKSNGHDEPSSPSQDRRGSRRRRPATLPWTILKSEDSARQKLALGIVGILFTVAVIFVWWLLTREDGPIPDLFFASPTEVIEVAQKYFAEPYNGTTLIGHTLSSLKTVMTGWLIAAILGVPFGVWIGWSEKARWTLYPVFQIIRPIPPIAWIPLALVWFGIGDPSRVFVVFLSAFVPWTINAIYAVESIDKNLIKAARVFGAKDSYILRRVVLKTGIPTILAAAQIALGNAWTTVVAAELLGASSGLGYVALTSSRTLEIDVLIMSMILLGLVGAILSLGMQSATKLLAPRGVKL